MSFRKILTLLVFVTVSVHCKNHLNVRKKNHFQLKENKIEENPVASTESGQIQGIRNQTVSLQRNYYAFKGIPYAKPPINELRFEPPVHPEKWEGIYQATDDSKACVISGLPGAPIVGQEDCLYLNVYTPSLPSTTTNSSLLVPVMVFIHGGGFRNGNSIQSSYGPDYLLDQDVVVVTLNYRLGILGFISTNDLVAPGNVGLKDQNFALKWVQTHIKNFGGDPKKVTIFGESAGSASVSYHMQSQKSAGLFRSAILESGTTLCPWALSRYSIDTTIGVGNALGSDTSSSQSLLEDLKKVKLQDLQNVATLIEIGFLLIEGPLDGLVWGPVIEPEHEGAFFTGKSHQQLLEGKFNKVPAIIGYNSREANLFFESYGPPIQIYASRYNVNLSRIAPLDMNIDNLLTKYNVGGQIKKQYFGLLSLIGSNSDDLSEFVSVSQFNKPIRETIVQASKYADIYFYRFSYSGLLGGGENYSAATGAAHAEELFYIWHKNRTYNAKDAEVRRKLVELFTNFAKFSNPTPSKDQALDNVIWVKARYPNSTSSMDALNFIEINYNLTISQNPDQKNWIFWSKLYKKYGHPPYTTY